MNSQSNWVITGMEKFQTTCISRPNRNSALDQIGSGIQTTALLASIVVSTAASAQAGSTTLIRTNVSLGGFFQASPGGEEFETIFPETMVVSDEKVEFPNANDLSRYNANLPSGVANDLVNLTIDVAGNFIELDFKNIRSYRQFAQGYKNSYVLTFTHKPRIRIRSAEIDYSVTTLALTEDRISVSENQLLKNVESLNFDRITLTKLVLMVDKDSMDLNFLK